MYVCVRTDATELVLRVLAFARTRVDMCVCASKNVKRMHVCVSKDVKMLEFSCVSVACLLRVCCLCA